MKAKINEIKEKKFSPFSITIQIDSERELLNMRSRFINDNVHEVSNSLIGKPVIPVVNVYQIWELLGKKLKEL